ncbi:HAD-IIIA family hydrolase [Clostridium sp. P21]|uniref:D,D-heptose 1,7-bisphosphate phosphatase n=1 Tax=Clostridium muellerianum TaxID=2716538 RepID=A0A7Y0EG28_9CLOT|nr:HAD-IIIA family hydrolase [Clostridium muellerianum]NMM62846.1 HAD-IIIA family hydrolase [Clostridium muellerianum]
MNIKDYNSKISNKKLEAIFIDRDGTIGGTDEVVYPGEFQLFSFVVEAIKILKAKGIKIISFTNQPGISKGKATKEDFIKELTGFGFDDCCICPHDESEGCICRKPKTAMLEKAAVKHNLNLKKCLVIGDRWSDMLAASKVDSIKILVLTGAGKDALEKYRHKWNNCNAEFIATNILEAVRWLENEKYI